MSAQLEVDVQLDDFRRNLDIEMAIEKAAHLLPAQGPINVFVHHNTLHAFEELDFHSAVLQGASMFGCHPYLSEVEYRRELNSGTISVEDLRAALLEDLGDRDDDLIGCLGTRFALRRSMLSEPLHVAPASELRWLVSESDALRRFGSKVRPEVRDQMVSATRRCILRLMSNGQSQDQPSRRITAATHELLHRFDGRDPTDWGATVWESFTLHLLWRICRQGVHDVGRPPSNVSVVHRHRDLLYALSGQDADLDVNELLVRFCAAFLDQGLSHWNLPDRDAGFYQSFIDMYSHAPLASIYPMRGLSKELRRIAERGILPIESIAESLRLLGVASDEVEGYVSKTLLALRGWAGMIYQMETRADRVPRAAPKGSLIGFLAIRLILDRLAVAQIAERHCSVEAPLHSLRAELKSRLGKVDDAHLDARAFAVFQIAQLNGWPPESLFRLPKETWRQLTTCC